nr:MAG TPA: hypothetical protein [Caudoviricetes sp.]
MYAIPVYYFTTSNIHRCTKVIRYARISIYLSICIFHSIFLQ